jgi:hypothetical protein
MSFTINYIPRSRRRTLAEAAEKHKNLVIKTKHTGVFTLMDTETGDQTGLLQVLNEHLGTKAFRQALVNIYNGTSCALVGLSSGPKRANWTVASVVYPEIESPTEKNKSVVIHYRLYPSGRIGMSDVNLAAHLNKEHVVVDNQDGSIVGVGMLPVVKDAMHCSYIVNRLQEKGIENKFTIRRLLRPFLPDEALAVIDVAEFFTPAELRAMSPA